jgi:hypothetical protein
MTHIYMTHICMTHIYMTVNSYLRLKQMFIPRISDVCHLSRTIINPLHIKDVFPSFNLCIVLLLLSGQLGTQL